MVLRTSWSALLAACAVVLGCAELENPTSEPEQSKADSSKTVRVSILSKAGATKGEVGTTSNLNVDGNRFAMDTWTGGSHSTYTFTCSTRNNAKIWSDASCLWPESGSVDFWATYPLSVNGRSGLSWDNGASNPGFSYDMSALTSGTNAAELSSDILLGYTSASKPASGDACINIEFQHALSTILFRKGVFAEGFDISEIKISGISLKGECGVSLVSGKPSFDWTLSDTPSSTVGLAQSMSLSDLQTLSDKELENGAIPAGSKIFFLIPQNPGDESRLQITIANGSVSTQKVAVLKGLQWLPGSEYVYDLNFDEQGLTVVASIDGWIQKEQTISFE